MPSLPPSPLALAWARFSPIFLLKGEVSAKYVPVAAIMMTVFLIDLYFASGQVNARLQEPTLNGVRHFLFRLGKLARCL